MRKLFFVAPGILEIPTIRGGGIEYNIFQIAKRLSIFSVIFSPRPQGAYPSQKNNFPDIKYSMCPSTDNYPLQPHFQFSSIKMLLITFVFYLEASLRILWHSKKINTVVVFDKFWGVIPFIFALLTGKDRIYMEYNIWPWTYSKNHRPLAYSLQTRFGSLICRMSSLVIANSPSIIRGMISQGVVPSKIHILPTGANFQKLSRYDINEKESISIQILYVGRLVEERGADLLVDIVLNTLKINQNAKFLIIGGGPLFDNIHKSVIASDLTDKVLLLGQISHKETIEYILGSDIVIFISRNENFGSLALLESLALGRPIIATDVGSTSKIVVHGKNGLLVQPEANSIAYAIRDLAANQKQRTQMGIESRKIAKNYDWDIIASKFSEILQNGLYYMHDNTL